MLMNSKLKMIINIVGFYIGRWGCILVSSNGYRYIGPLLTLAFIILHANFFIVNPKEIQLIVIVGVVGTIVDSCLFFSQSFIYAEAYSENLFIAPLWITAMWAGFAATVNHSMTFFKGKWLLMVVAGAVFGPAAYYTGEGFGAITFQSTPLLSILIIGAVWALAMPLVFFINKKLGLGG